jgi:N-acetyl-anhydromuramyl-L-alanine amidase AmpD
MEVLKVGSTGKDVKTLQTLLNNHGYNLRIDGDFGEITENAVEDFQEKNNLTSDGIVGKNTWVALYDDDDKPEKINDTRYVLRTKNYFDEIIPKKAITLHHTNGWVVKNGKPSMNHFNWWTSKNSRVSTAFSIDYAGKIYQHFDPLCWAYHLGLIDDDNLKMNQEAIGIELCNEGYLTKENETFYWWSGKLKLKYNRPQDKPFHIPEGWRKYEWYAPYSEEQIKSTIWLVKYLCDEYNIKKNVINDFDYHPELLDGNFEGIYSHSNVRDFPRPKWDLSPAFPINRLVAELKK